QLPHNRCLRPLALLPRRRFDSNARPKKPKPKSFLVFGCGVWALGIGAQSRGPYSQSQNSDLQAKKEKTHFWTPPCNSHLQESGTVAVSASQNKVCAPAELCILYARRLVNRFRLY